MSFDDLRNAEVKFYGLNIICDKYLINVLIDVLLAAIPAM